jgi:hypothetical protein
VPAVAVALAAVIAPQMASADDGAMLRKEVTKTPDLESDHAQLSMMQFYVEATRASGALVSEDDKNPTESGQVEYWGDDPAIEDVNQGERDYIAFTRGYAKPLVVSYWDEAESEDSGYDIMTGDEVGVDIRRDAYLTISLDDGETWKERNLSESALESSFTLENGLEYPGDVTELVHGVAGHKIRLS